MITLFRRIRKKLIGDGNVRRYVIYAIGEIALVVIGILIALQVNNWNEERVSGKEEVFYLGKLSQGIAQDTILFNEMIDYLDVNLNRLNILSRELYNTDLEYFSIDITVPLLRTTKAPLERSTWDNLISTGKISLIQNKEVSDSLFQYYYKYEEEVEGWNEAITQYSREITAPFLLQFDDINYAAFDTELEVPSLGKKTIAEYRNEEMFRNLIRFRISSLKNVAVRYERSLTRARNLLQMIEQQLDERR